MVYNANYADNFFGPWFGQVGAADQNKSSTGFLLPLYWTQVEWTSKDGESLEEFLIRSLRNKRNGISNKLNRFVIQREPLETVIRRNTIERRLIASPRILTTKKEKSFTVNDRVLR
jgi:hypothetical protein